MSALRRRMLRRWRQRTWAVLDMGEARDRFSHAVDVALVAMILANVLAAVLGSMSDVTRHYSTFLEGFALFSAIVFSIEYVAWLWSCTAKRDYRRPILGRLRYALTPLALVDLIVILPFWIALAGATGSDLRALRALRLLLLFKLGRYWTSLRLFARVWHRSREELGMAVILMAVLVLLSASLMYVVEHQAQPEKFPDIPAAMWWAIVTLTTVGYGDVVPVTALGRIIGAVIAVLGIGMFALPAGILGAKFTAELRRHRHVVTTCPHCGKTFEPD